MTDYTELIRSLRNCSNNRCTPCDCGWFNKYQVDESCKEIIMWKAAAAIEALQAQLPKRGEIVRCGECKWYQPDLCANPWGVCFHEDWVENNIGHTVDEDGFCYRGEREVQE